MKKVLIALISNDESENFFRAMVYQNPCGDLEAVELTDVHKNIYPEGFDFMEYNLSLHQQTRLKQNLSRVYRILDGPVSYLTFSADIYKQDLNENCVWSATINTDIDSEGDEEEGDEEEGDEEEGDEEEGDEQWSFTTSDTYVTMTRTARKNKAAQHMNMLNEILRTE